MSLQVIEGDTGSGKSYIVVNGFMADYLRDSERPVYTNLPLRLDEYFAHLTSNVARQSAMRERLHMVEERMAPVSDDIWLAWVKGACGACKGDFPPQGLVFDKKTLALGDIISAELWAQWKEEVAGQMRKGFIVEPDPHCVQLLKEGRIRNTLREFWWFLPVNSVVFMDECADLWNAKNLEDRPSTLSTFVNHQRHYRLDIFVLCQSRADIDVQVRNKFNYVWIVTNSLTQKVGTHWLLVGMKWPIQFFTASQYAGRIVFGKGGDLRRYEPAGPGKRLFSTRAGFRNYHSHSVAGSLPGLKTSGDQGESEDVRTPWQQVQQWVYRLWLPLAYFGGILVGGVVMWKLLFGFMDATSGKVKVASGARSTAGGSTNRVTAATNAASAVAVKLASGSQTNESKTKVKQVGRMVSSGGSNVNGRRLALGDKCAGSVIARFWSGGVVLADGRVISWAVLPGS